jgi:hypothetical protein
VTTIFKDLSAALEARLATLSGLPAVAWPNLNYVPTLGTLFIRPTILPAETVGATMGTSTGTDSQSGIYQIDIFAPSGVGRSATTTLADAIADHFSPLTELTYNSQIVTIISVSQGVAYVEDAWYHTPIEIKYLSYTTARP